MNRDEEGDGEGRGRDGEGREKDGEGSWEMEKEAGRWRRKR